MEKKHTNPVRVQKYLKGVDYPINKKDLIKHAEKRGADTGILSALKGLPEVFFRTPADVNQAIAQSEAA